MSQNDSEYVGLWHIDGQLEPVVAVVLFYYHVSTDLAGGNIEFMDRKPLWVSDLGNDDFNAERARDLLRPAGGETGSPSFSKHANCSVPIKEGTLLVFSNFQMAHRVLKMINRSTTSEESRDFVALFIMDPTATPLVPAPAHLANQYVYERTLQCLVMPRNNADDEERPNKRPAQQIYPLTDKPLHLVLEFAGIVPAKVERLRRRNELLRSQLKPRGRIGYANDCIYATGNGCWTMIGWLDSYLHPDSSLDSFFGHTKESYRSWGLNMPSQEVGRGLSETLSVSSRELAKTHLRATAFWCDVCEERLEDAILGYRCLDVAACPNFNVCEDCHESQRGELEVRHKLESFRLLFSCSECQAVISGTRHHCTKCLDHDVCEKCLDANEASCFYNEEHAFIPLRKDWSVDKSHYRYTSGLVDGL